MKKLLLGFILLFWSCLLPAQSFRLLSKENGEVAVFSPQQSLIYTFENIFDGPGVLHIRDSLMGKIQRTLTIDTLPRFQTLSIDGRSIYFFSGVRQNKLYRFDLKTEVSEKILTLPDSIQEVFFLRPVPNRADDFIISWSKDNIVGLTLIQGSKLVDTHFDPFFPYVDLAFQNDSVFFSYTIISYSLRKGKLLHNTIEVKDTIKGLPESLAGGKFFNDFFITYNGQVADFRSLPPKVIGGLLPNSPIHNGASMVDAPFSSYLYFVREFNEKLTVFKVAKQSRAIIDEWDILKPSSDFQGIRWIVPVGRDGFFFSSEKKSYLYRRCVAKTPTARILEGAKAYLCSPFDSLSRIQVADRAFEYHWSNGASTSAILPDKEGPIQVSYGDEQGCLSFPSAVTTVSFVPKPRTPIIQRDGKNLFTDNPAILHEWFLDDQLVAIFPSPIFTISNNGTYRVRVKSEHCYSPYSAPFTVNGLLTSNHEPDPRGKSVSLSPNPSSHFLQIRTNGAYFSGKNYQVLNLLGKHMQNGQIAAGGSIDISSLASGTYFLCLTDEAEQKQILKFIKL
jgi:Secretion system C-terminal sorting domain